MKQYLTSFLLFICVATNAQFKNEALPTPAIVPFSMDSLMLIKRTHPALEITTPKWKFSKNHVVTGALVFTAGMFKGFNETLQFHWKAFRLKHPGANPNWFNPAISWKNKYENNDPKASAKFPLSTSVLVMFTDQYHLNNFIIKMSWGSALIIKVGEKKKPLKHYLLDMLYYTACHQAGFALMYYPYKK